MRCHASPSHEYAIAVAKLGASSGESPLAFLWVAHCGKRDRGTPFFGFVCGRALETYSLYDVQRVVVALVVQHG